MQYVDFCYSGVNKNGAWPLCPNGFKLVFWGVYTGSLAGCRSPYPQVLSKPYGCCPRCVKGYFYTVSPQPWPTCYDHSTTSGKCCKSLLIAGNTDIPASSG